jgi:hypothetical protein
MPKPVRIIVESSAQQAIMQMTPAQRGQFLRLADALRLAPRAGVFYAKDGQDRILYQVSAADIHLIYTLVYRVWANDVFVVAIEIAEWTPQHSDMRHRNDQGSSVIHR